MCPFPGLALDGQTLRCIRWVIRTTLLELCCVVQNYNPRNSN